MGKACQTCKEVTKNKYYGGSELQNNQNMEIDIKDLDKYD